jgi:hypothetical protein
MPSTRNTPMSEASNRSERASRRNLKLQMGNKSSKKKLGFDSTASRTHSRAVLSEKSVRTKQTIHSNTRNDNLRNNIFVEGENHKSDGNSEYSSEDDKDDAMDCEYRGNRDEDNDDLEENELDDDDLDMINKKRQSKKHKQCYLSEKLIDKSIDTTKEHRASIGDHSSLSSRSILPTKRSETQTDVDSNLQNHMLSKEMSITRVSTKAKLWLLVGMSEKTCFDE